MQADYVEGAEMHPAPERLNLAECAELLGMSPRQFSRELKASLAQSAAGRDRLRRLYWREEDVYRWAARALPQAAKRVPITFWPQSDAPARYLGARTVGQSAVGLGWATQLGDLWVAWDYPSDKNATLVRAAAEFPSAAALTVIGGDFGRRGPAVWAILPGSADKPKYELPWSKLAEVLGATDPVLAVFIADSRATVDMAAG